MSDLSEGRKWVCIQCGEELGQVLGNEIRPSIDGKYLLTRGANLVFTCPKCGATKVFYTADPVVKAIYQLVDAIAGLMVERVLREVRWEEKKKGQN